MTAQERACDRGAGRGHAVRCWRRGGALLAAVALLVGSLGSSSALAANPGARATPALVPNVSIGGAMLGAKSAAAVKKALGGGVAVSAAGDEVSQKQRIGPLVARIYAGQVVEIETTSPVFVTAQGGVHVGSPASAVRAAYGGTIKTNGDSLYIEGATTLQTNKVRTYFDINNGRIITIRMGYFPWLTPCYGGPTTISGATLTGSVTWGLKGCPYVVTGQVTIPTGVSLTVKPGVIVKFSNADSGMLISGGALVGQGAQDSPVVFTSINDQTHGALSTTRGTAPRAGAWGALWVNGAGGSLTLNNAAVYYGGGDRFRSAGVFVDGGGAATVAVKNSVLAYNQGYGIDVAKAPAGTTIHHTAFYGNEKPLHLSGEMSLDGSNVFTPAGLTPNRQNGIFVDDSAHIAAKASKVVWAENRVPFVLTGNTIIQANAALELGPGVIVKGRDTNARLGVEGGTLKAGGTATQPDVFTSFADDDHGGDTNGDGAQTRAKPGDWIGLGMLDPRGTVTLANVQVFYGGADRFRPADLSLEGSAQSVIVQNSVFAMSSGWGVDAGKAAPTIQLTGNTFYGNKQPLQLGPGLSLDASNTFTGKTPNMQNGIFFTHDVDLTQGSAVTLAETDVSFVIAGTLKVETGASLTLRPGVTLKGVDTSAALQVYGGTLNVQGTATQPVVLTSLFDDGHGGKTTSVGTTGQPKPGDWTGLQVWSASRATMSHLKVFYGGADRFRPHNITIEDQALASLSDSEVAYSAGNGIYLSSSRPTLIRGTNIHDNMGFGLDYSNKNAQSATTSNGNTLANNKKGNLGVGDVPATAP